MVAPPSDALRGYALKRRLRILILVPLALLAALNAWYDIRVAGSAAEQQDRKLERMAVLMADSVIGPAPQEGLPPIVMLAPDLSEFLRDGQARTGYRLSTVDGQMIDGDTWVPAVKPRGFETEFVSAVVQGATVRIVVKQLPTSAGDLVIQIADGSNPQQQWVRVVLLRVVLPNLLFGLAAFFAVSWAVDQALKPLMQLKRTMEERDPQDLSEIAPQNAPQEVRPLVDTLNQLFGTVSAQSAQQRRFVSDAAHQLRTPLAALQSQVEAWAKAAESDGGVFLPQAELDRLRSATRRTSGLVNQLLALSRADAQAMRSQPRQQVDLRALAEDVLSAALDTAAQRGIDLGLDAQDARANGIEWMLREALANLVDNALRYTPAGGRVTVRCRPFSHEDGLAYGVSGDDGRARVLLEVVDTGPGIDASERTRVVERFYRGAGAVGDGTGLGLAIAHEIALVHDTLLLFADGHRPDAGSPTKPRGLRVGMALDLSPMPQ